MARTPASAAPPSKSKGADSNYAEAQIMTEEPNRLKWNEAREEYYRELAKRLGLKPPAQA